MSAPTLPAIGRAWADREWALDNEDGKLSSVWFCTYHDALPLVPDNRMEPARTIAAEAINEAARKRWARLVAKASA